MKKDMAEIIERMKTLEPKEYDCVSYEFNNGKAIFIQVTNYDGCFEYLYEANNIVDDAFEPYSDWNASSPFGDFNKARETLIGFINEYDLNK